MQTIKYDFNYLYEKQFFLSTGYQIDNQYAVYFVTFSIVDWVDLFSRKVYRDVVIDSLRFCSKEKGLEISAYVIMTNHVHLIVKAAGPIPLSDIIRDFKKYTAKRFLEIIESEPESRRDWLLHRFKYNASRHQRNSIHQIWMHDNHAEEIKSRKFLAQKMKYIHDNPVRAGWVDMPEDYVYSSAYELSGRGNKITLADAY